jgi:hypothetical protein
LLETCNEGGSWGGGGKVGTAQVDMSIKSAEVPAAQISAVACLEKGALKKSLAESTVNTLLLSANTDVQ